MSRDANPEYPIHPLLSARYSPYAFDPARAVSKATVQSLFEAARWTMSSYNAQPWRYIVGIKDDGTDTWEKVHACLVEGNQPWARNAPVLALGLVKTTFDHNGKANSAAEHDLGAASAFLTLEAVSRGLCVHQMVGIDPGKVIATFAPGPDIKPLTALAIGFQGEPGHIPEAYAERDRKPRARLLQGEFLL
ncbi:MAG: nitroreductase family protein [Halioglobus sp.]|nr:nitroreductase family protein [Halioglobus sp.]